MAIIRKNPVELDKKDDDNDVKAALAVEKPTCGCKNCKCDSGSDIRETLRELGLNWDD